jgi:hypothetical protein
MIPENSEQYVVTRFWLAQTVSGSSKTHTVPLTHTLLWLSIDYTDVTGGTARRHRILVVQKLCSDASQ